MTCRSNTRALGERRPVVVQRTLRVVADQGDLPASPMRLEMAHSRHGSSRGREGNLVEGRDGRGVGAVAADREAGERFQRRKVTLGEVDGGACRRHGALAAPGLIQHERQVDPRVGAGGHELVGPLELAAASYSLPLASRTTPRLLWAGRGRGRGQGSRRRASAWSGSREIRSAARAVSSSARQGVASGLPGRVVRALRQRAHPGTSARMTHPSSRTALSASNPAVMASPGAPPGARSRRCLRILDPSNRT